MATKCGQSFFKEKWKRKQSHWICNKVRCNFILKLEVAKMTNPQGMDELFWGRDHEDVND